MRRDLSFRTLWMMCGIIAFMVSATSAQPQTWQTSAKWHRAFKKAESGLLMLNAEGVEFRSPKFSRHYAAGLNTSGGHEEIHLEIPQ